MNGCSILQDSENELQTTSFSLLLNKSFNESLIHQVVVAYMSGSRQGTKAQKNRALVAGSNKKPWRQKGTGRARSGTLKSPIWRSGGVTFAAKPRHHMQKVNKKMYKGAMLSILSELLRQKRLIFVKDLFIDFPKTKLLIEKLKNIGFFSLNDTEKILIVISNSSSDGRGSDLFLAARNLYWVSISNVNKINPISLINCDRVVVTFDAVKKLEEIYT